MVGVSKERIENERRGGTAVPAVPPIDFFFEKNLSRTKTGAKQKD